MKTPKTALIVSITAALVVLAASAAIAQRTWDDGRDWKAFKTENIRQSLSFADQAQTGEVVVDNVFGPIAVEGHAGREVVLEAQKVVYARDEARARRAEEEVKLEVTEKGATVEIYVDGPFRENDREDRERGNVRIRRDPGYRVHYAFTLKVPFKSDLVLSTVTDGDIEVKNVEGAFDVRNVNGRVRLVDVAGSGDARTVSGGVTVAFKRHPDGACLFKTVSGDVEVDFPGRPSADFRLKTMHGEVYTDFEVTYLPKAPPVREERGGRAGKYVYRSDGAYGVRVGQGGPEIRLETLAGDILIAKRTKSTS
jgi:hypothetical protein